MPRPVAAKQRGRKSGNRGKRTSGAKSGSNATLARRTAVELVREVRERDAYARELIDKRRAGWAQPKEEFDYMQVLVFGVTMCRGTLDFFINRNLNSPKDIKDNVRDALQVSAYELLYLRKPDHVVVDQGVELVRYVAPKAAGLANAVLRKMTRDADGFPWGDAEHENDAFARQYAVPQWFTEDLIMQYGYDLSRALLEACLRPAPTYTVENPYLSGSTFAADLASQQVASMVPVDGCVLEIGAGRGTKTMLMQRNAHFWYGHAARIHTVDIHAFKEQLLRARMDEQRVPNVITHTGDACRLGEIDALPNAFDAVFIDVPCSGTGTLRRHPEIRWRLHRNDVKELARLQKRMIKQVASRVKVGGVLVYATCSILRRENQEVVTHFLKSEEGHGFSVVEPAPAFECFEDCITDEGFFASLPAQDGPDGHFAVVLHRDK